MYSMFMFIPLDDTFLDVVFMALNKHFSVDHMLQKAELLFSCFSDELFSTKSNDD